MLSRVFGFGRRPFRPLSEQEILALAISSEEDDGRIYRAYADGLRDAVSAIGQGVRRDGRRGGRHRAALIELHRERFGERIPLIRREHVRGYYERKPDWLVQAARHRQGARARPRRWSGRPTASIVEAAKRTDRCLDPQAARRPRGGGEGA